MARRRRMTGRIARPQRKKPLAFAIQTESGNAMDQPGSRLHNLYVEALPQEAPYPVNLVSAPGVAEMFRFPGAGGIIAMAVVPLWDFVSPGIDETEKERKHGRFRLLMVADNGWCAAPEVVPENGAVRISTRIALGEITPGSHWESTGGWNLSPGNAAYENLVPVRAGENYSVVSSDNMVGYERVLFYNTDNPLLFADYVGDVEDGTTKPLDFTVPAGATHMGINVHDGATAELRLLHPLHDSFTMGTSLGTAAARHPTRARIAHNGRDAVIATDAGTYKWEVHADDNTPQGFAVLPTPHATDFQDVTWQDGYIIYAQVNGTWGHSELNTLSFRAGADTATAEANPDGIVGIKSWNSQVYIFGRQSIEVWYNSGGVDLAFSRQHASTHSVGCVARDTIQANEQGVFFVGRDNHVYMAGSGMTAISTPSVEYDVALADRDTMRAFIYSEQGHRFYCLTLEDPHLGGGYRDVDDNPVPQKTWIYDMDTGLWHTRDLGWVRAHAEIFDLNLVAGGTAIVHRLAREHCNDANGQPVVHTAIGPTLHRDRKKSQLNEIEVNLVFRDYEKLQERLKALRTSDPCRYLRVAVAKDGTREYLGEFSIPLPAERGLLTVGVQRGVVRKDIKRPRPVYRCYPKTFAFRTMNIRIRLCCICPFVIQGVYVTGTVNHDHELGLPDVGA